MRMAPPAGTPIVLTTALTSRDRNNRLFHFSEVFLGVDSKV